MSGLPGQEERLTPIATPSISPTQVAYMLVANNDTAEVHLDEAFARLAGLPGAVVPGSFVLGYMGQLLTRRFGFAAIRSLDVRFVSAVFLREPLSVAGAVRSSPEGEDTVVDLEVSSGARVVATGVAKIARQSADASR